MKRLSERELEIAWADGHVCRYGSVQLRADCPCAVCKGHGPREELPPPGAPRDLGPNAALMSRLDDLWLIGRYALGMKWGDGHDTGIYTWTYLRERCPGGAAGADLTPPAPRP